MCMDDRGVCVRSVLVCRAWGGRGGVYRMIYGGGRGGCAHTRE